MTAPPNGSTPSRTDFGVVIVGSGFGGLGMAIRLKQDGYDDFCVLERAADIGGTWRDNTYPGAACDVPSHLYSFSFAPNPNWSRSFSPQPEIQEYLRTCARRFGVLPHLRFGTTMTAASWDETARRWVLETSRGRYTARALVSAVGALSDPSIPDLPGLERFAGTTFHSAQWRHDYDLTGRRVAVVGTGASAIQFVPQIQPKVEQLHIMQRTAPWVTPRMDRPVSKAEHQLFHTFPFAQRLARLGIYWGRESYVLGFAVKPKLMKVVESIAKRHLRKQVAHPELRAKLTPSYTIGCKRILISNDYYPAITKSNVDVVTSGIAEIREKSIVTADGTEWEIDTIIFGTGFHVTDFPVADHIHGRNGRRLSDVWQGSPQAYLGSAVAGFPNLYFLLGPSTGLGHTSQVFMIEAQIDYTLDALRSMRKQRIAVADVRPEVQARYFEQVQDRMRGTVWTSGGCRSWYLDSNGKNTTIWPRATWRFRRLTRRFQSSDYRLEYADTPRPTRQAPHRTSAPVGGGD